MTTIQLIKFQFSDLDRKAKKDIHKTVTKVVEEHKRIGTLLARSVVQITFVITYVNVIYLFYAGTSLEC